MLEPEPNEQDYLRQIGLLARDVVRAADTHAWPTCAEDVGDENALQRAIDELASHIWYRHFEGDGCIEDDRPLLHLGGAALILHAAGHEKLSVCYSSGRKGQCGDEIPACA